jgi:hypothetical protein
MGVVRMDMRELLGRIVGKFDPAWSERFIFGKIRYPSLGSTGKKFDSNKVY